MRTIEAAWPDEKISASASSIAPSATSGASQVGFPFRP
jgi:hypothetical protein